MEQAGGSAHAIADDLIVCTRNRPSEVRDCLATVAAQTRVPVNVVVVDSSGDDATLRVVEALVPTWPASSSLRHVRSEPATTRQRNVGIDVTRGVVVHFVDDDTLLDPGYIEAVLGLFEADRTEAIAGVGGFVTNQPEHRLTFVDELLGLDSRREGVVLPSGRNTRLYTEPAWPVEVDWLAGCAMSFRRAVFDTVRPDSRRGTNRNGEDLDLSYRVRQHWPLLITPRARILHLEAAEGRRTAEELAVVEMISRYERVLAGTGVYSRRAFWISVWGQLAWFTFKAAVTLSRSRFAIARATLRGIRAIRAARRSGLLILAEPA
ncbi:MAG: glycosyltransferase [Acidimicrobiia bacterium]|nr:glycosyltransferase [Acidimicrobiia bacterium]